VLPCLHRIQHERGFIAAEDIKPLAEYLGVPAIQIEEVLAFYSQFRRQPVGRWYLQFCRNVVLLDEGRRAPDPARRRQARHPSRRDHRRWPLHARSTVECLGSCGTAPMMMVNEPLPREPLGRGDRPPARGAEVAMPGRQLFMTFPVTASSHTLAEYQARGGYASLEKALGMSPKDVVREVTQAGIQGRGGAAFEVGRKWAVIQSRRRPAALPDRQCRRGRARHLQGPLDPRERAAPAGRGHADRGLGAGGAPRFIYIRGEFDLPYRRIQGAVDEARAAGLCGENILGTGFSLRADRVHRGAGAYVCGEASGLLTSLEGKKSYPRNRPPRLTVRGLYQRPTVVNNVETLANVARILGIGAEAFGPSARRRARARACSRISGHIVQARRLRGRDTAIRGSSSWKRTAAGSSAAPSSRP
jgi:NADH:ubiquinone oxidoreductase subunit E